MSTSTHGPTQGLYFISLARWLHNLENEASGFIIVSHQINYILLTYTNCMFLLKNELSDILC